MRSSALWRVRPYLRPYWRRMVVMTIAAALGLGAGTLVPLVIKAVIDGPLARGERSGIPLLALAALALGVFESVAAHTRRYVAGNVSLGLETALRNDLYSHLQRLPVRFHDEWQSGQLLSRAMSDCRIIRRFFGFGIVFLVVNVLTFAIVLALMAQLDPWLTAIPALTAVPLVLLSRRFEKEYLAASRRVQDADGDLTTLIEEAATGIRTIKSFGRRELVARQFLGQADTLRSLTMAQVRLRARFWALIDMIPNLATAAVLLGGALAVGRGSLTLGGLVAFVSLLILLVWPIESLGEILAMAEEASAAADRIFEVLDTEPAVRDRPGARRLEAASGALVFEDVAFRYAGAGSDVLHGIRLQLEPGETVAVVGATGTGKTTLVSLVPRLYDVTAGRITLDGHDLRDVELASLRRHVAVAFEEPILFSASVRENVLLGHPGATESELASALDAAQAHFAFDLPWGLETRVGEQGLSLSGGQRQRLALARAIIGGPRVLVLDDPLSALDVHTEALVEAALRQVLSDVTALVVVHRPSTVAVADRVAFLDGGTVAAVGTHTELMRTVPAYRAVLSQEADAAEEMAS